MSCIRLKIIRGLPFFMICSASFSGQALADGSGSYTSELAKMQFVHAYAYRHVDNSDDSEQVTTIFFGSKAINSVKIDMAQPPDREGELRKQQIGGKWAELNIGADGSVVSVRTHGDDRESLDSDDIEKSERWYKLDLKRNDDQHIEGTFQSTDPKRKRLGTDGYYDLRFARTSRFDAHG